jgi:hypothetical protein
MNGRKLQDRLYLGLGISARRVGQLADAFRPTGPDNPLSSQNRFLRLPATFISSGGRERRTNGYGDPMWQGIFDGSYTRVSDYLVTPDAIFFVVSQDHLLPILCVRTNRTICIMHPSMQTNIANNAYGGYTSGSSTMLMNQWPASVLGENKSGRSVADLPTDQMVPYWNVLVPSVTGVVLSPGDIITDDLGRTGLINSSELTNLGWRISAKMATT